MLRKKWIFLTLFIAVILSAILTVHFLVRTKTIDFGSGDSYQTVHLLGTDFFFYKSTPGILSGRLIDTEKGDGGQISRFRFNQKDYAALVYAGGIKLFDGSQFVSAYENENGLETLSSFIADCDGDGNDDPLLLLKQERDTYGKKLVGLRYNGKQLEKTYVESFQKVNPWKVQVCDVDGDGKVEVSLGVYTVAKFHPTYAKRPFIYYFHANRLYPKWLGSRLSRPFDDYIFCDIDGDKMDELISVENTRDGKKELNAYKWTGFGFESIGVSKTYKQLSGLKTDGKRITVVCADTAEPKRVGYQNGKLIMED